MHHNSNEVQTNPDYELWMDYYSKENIDFFGEVYRNFRTKRAPIEAGFAIDTLQLKTGEYVLDLCCGLGHNAVFLAQQGLRIVGVDFSTYSIQRARELAVAKGTKAVFWEGDARKIPWKQTFDAVTMLFNSFGYPEDDEADQIILQKLAASLKYTGRFLIEVCNRDAALEKARKGCDDFVIENGLRQQVFYQFDGQKNRLFTKRVLSKGGWEKELYFSQRAYTYVELVSLLKNVGLRITSAYGAYDGSPLTHDVPSFLVLGDNNGEQTSEPHVS